jgi:hypothetical protein
MRNKFWLGMAAIGLAALLLFLLGALPVMRKNDKELATLQERAEALEKISEGPVKNQQWIEEEEERREAYQQQLQIVRQELADRDALIERHFRDPDNPETEPPLEGARWKQVYRMLIDRLHEQLEGSVTAVAREDPLEVAQFGPVWPRPEEMRRHEKRYWVQKAVVDVIDKVNTGQKVVPVFESFRFRKRPERFMHRSHRTNFNCLSFALRVRMEFEDVPLLLHSLFASEYGFEVTSVALDRTGGVGGRRAGPSPAPAGAGFEAMGRGGGGGGFEAMGPPGGGGGGFEAMGPPGGGRGGGRAAARRRRTAGPASGTGEALSDTLLNVVVSGYVPDYEQAQAKPAGPRAPKPTGAGELRP